MDRWTTREICYFTLLCGVALCAVFYSIPSNENPAFAGSDADVEATALAREEAPIRQTVNPITSLKYAPILSDKVQLITSHTQTPFYKRMQACHSLPRDLSEYDQSALLRFIASKPPADCNAEQWHVLVNDLLNSLRVQKLTSPKFSNILVSIYKKNTDPVMKDYAIQHLHSWFSAESLVAGHETDPAKRSIILETLVEAASASATPYAGTSLIALHYSDQAFKERGNTELDGVDIDSLVIKAALDPRANRLCRITALQIASQRGLSEVVPVAREMMHSDTTDFSLRLSAIAVIGAHGEASDLETLQKISKSIPQLKPAAKSAHRKLASK